MFHLNPDYKSRFRILKGGKISLVISAFIASITMLHAAPSGGVVTVGNASISQSGSVTNIIQSTQKAAINWQNFSIGTSETVNFNQPNVSSVILNRVIGNEKSIIDGALNANGQVWILNSNGVLFNSTARINTAGLIATTKNITDADFNAGNYKFTGESTESVVNMGEITISDKGYAALLADTVSNEGTIKAIQGTVVFANGEATINLNGNSLVNLTVDKGVLDSLIENKGAVLADGGKVLFTSKAADEILKNVVNNSGIIEAKGIDDLLGHVEIIAEGGHAENSGTIDVSNQTGKGGTATVTGYHTMISETGVINADGKTGGGTVYVGGSYQNTDTSVYQAEGTIVEHGAKLTANATDNGDGGTVVAWSDVYNGDSVTRAYGTFEAKGGVNGGDGGRIETSGAFLDVDAIDGISTVAAKGNFGSWLLDPTAITIDRSGNQYGSSYNNAGTYTNGYTSAVISADELQYNLANSTIIINSSSGGQAGSDSITVNSAITWSSATSLYLWGATININAPITGRGLSIRATTLNSSSAGTLTIGNNGLVTEYISSATLQGDVGVAGTWTISQGSQINAYNISSWDVYVTSGSRLNLKSSQSYGGASFKIDGTLDDTYYNHYLNYLQGSGSVYMNSRTMTLGGGSFSGTISDSGNGGSLVIDGTVGLSGTSSYSGSTTINSGKTLSLGSYFAISSTSSVNNNGGTLVVVVQALIIIMEVEQQLLMVI